MGLNYYFLDVETTGLKAGWHEISQISIIRHSDRNQISKYIKVRNPSRTSPEALAATGRTMDDLRKGISKEEAVDACHKFLLSDGQTEEHRCIVGHNISCDKRFCHATWEEVGKVFPALLWLDTMACSKHYLTRQMGLEKPSVKLDACMDHFGLTKRGDAHNAIVDTQHNFILYEHLKKVGFDFLPYIKRLPHEAPKTPELRED